MSGKRVERMPKVIDREYRSMPVMQIRAMDEGAEGQGFKVRGYAATFDEPYELYRDWDGNPIYEQIDAHAFDAADMSDVIMQFDHTGMVYARTRNGSLTVSTDDHGLWVEADLGLTEDSRKLYDAIAKGLIDRMSFCFTVPEGGDDWDKESRTSTIMRVEKLYDVSAVSIPANPGTDIAAERKKRMDGAIQEERAERLAQEALKRRIQRLKVRAKAIRAAE